ncbi:Alpha/Beta hydrolase protein [Microdochium trichocladiopsis]|uniref:Alpha/Beta hydrolase protein n=1 Tax=Microdochium trichocladiopsis TaxID=1682393 RepID=A0A9P8XYP4_9PEZI|nr:Alpha/Beta hydrolase protein [Microdochium trichocladiopsis]KAH7025263.1 Alpha/Beta hydrolase protein [Microdochium trichocladiopsis]
MDQNPVVVQPGPLRGSHAAAAKPLVLIHDGGGTVFGYFSLGNLKRKVWGVSNPHYSTAEPWAGGMDEMADHYIALIEKAGIRGPVLLGGWSLGGYLALLIAHKLKDRVSSPFSVSGLVLVDSPFHLPASQLTPCDAAPKLDHLPELVRKSFNIADGMLQTWELPEFDDPACGSQPVRFSVGSGRSFTVQPGTAMHKTLDGKWHVVEAKSFTAAQRAEAQAPPSPPDSDSGRFSPAAALARDSSGLPPALLIRCVLPTATEGDAPEGASQVDLYRADPYLGWGDHYHDFIKVIVDTEESHFNVFQFSHVSGFPFLLFFPFCISRLWH